MSKIEKRGQSLVEYLLLIAVVALGVVVGLTCFKDHITDAFNTVIDFMTERAG